MISEYKGWEDLSGPFRALNESTVRYAVLRNFEEISEEHIRDDFFIRGHDDIDILCDDPRKARRILKTFPEPLIGYLYHYKTYIGSVPVLFGIRHIGDGYYDEKWERDMLDSRVLTNGFFYALNREHYFYSLIYHAMIQKGRFSSEYRDRLIRMGNDMGSIREGEEADLPRMLRDFMKKNSYSFVYPKDVSVPCRFERVGAERIEGAASYRIRSTAARPFLKVRRSLRRRINGRKD